MDEKSFEVFGKVQNIMFRQTFIRALLKRELEGGATNDPKNKNRVTLTIKGDDQKMEELINSMKTLQKLNSWGAKVDKVHKLPEIIEINSHEVTHLNVDDFKWSQGVEFYL